MKQQPTDNKTSRQAVDELPINEYYEEYLEEYDDGTVGPVDDDETGAGDAALPEQRTIFKPRDRKPSFILAVVVAACRMLALAVVLAGLAGVGAVVGIARAYMDTAPELDLTLIDEQAQTSFIYDAQGNLITDYKGTENRVMVSIDTMPQRLRDAFIAVEDARFYTHNGVDLKRIVGAFLRNFSSGRQQGGSTITQQLIKNTLLSSEQSYKRKIQEAYLALQLETRYTKDQILESYLNTIYMGENYYGVKTAAYGYFGRENLNDLTLRECAMLAGLTTNPYYYNPRRNYFLRQSDVTDYRAVTDDRTDYVLRCMYENQMITRREYEDAMSRETANILKTSPESNEIYPYTHYVEYALRDVIQALLRLNKLENTAQNRIRMDNELRTGGYQVFLALDTEIQEILEDTVYNYTKYPALNDAADGVYRARNFDGTYEEIIQPQVAAVVTDYRTGEVKAIVGSRTKPTQRLTLNRASDMNMPVGSAIKPLSVYAPAVELGHGDRDIVNNMPLPIAGWKGKNGEDTWPRNYSANTYTGLETMRTALMRSHNTAAAFTLMNFVGVERSYDFLLRLGISPDHINKTPFGLALGSSGITPIEMAMAYGTLGNGGIYKSPITFKGIFDSEHHSLFDGGLNQVERQVFSPSTAWLTVDMMKDVVSKGTGTAAKISGQTVAGKTGTNSDQKGVFFAGMTGWYCGTVWIGHDNYKSLSSKTTGGNSAAALWQTFMSRIHKQKNLNNRDILSGSASEYGLTRVTTCKYSGRLATDACQDDGVETGWWPSAYVPTQYCDMHVQQTVCVDSGMVAGPYCTNTETRGVVSLPIGHPLTQFMNTEYQDVLTKYLGTSILSGSVCTWHTAPEYEDPYYWYDQYYNEGNPDPVYYTEPDSNTWQDVPQQETPAQTQYMASQALIDSARQVLNDGYQQLGWMQQGSDSYQNLSAACGQLSALLGGGATTEMLTEAMNTVQRAMAGY